MSYRIVFSDVDGTLLNSNHQLLNNTLHAIRQLQQREISFVIISARSPSSIYPIQETYGFRSPIISYSGTLILDEQRKALYVSGLAKKQAAEVIDFIEEKQFDCSWNIYFWNVEDSADTWIVKSKQDPRILREESRVPGTVHCKILRYSSGNYAKRRDQKQRSENIVRSVEYSADRHRCFRRQL